MFLFVLKTFAFLCTINKFKSIGGFDIQPHSARLLYGNDVIIEDFPYFASLVECGGAILSENWVITAAHCILHPESNYNRGINYIWVGGASLRSSKMVTYDNVVLPDYPSQSVPIGPDTQVPVNDIALLHLSKPLKFTDKIKPINLPAFEDTTWSNKDILVVAGRGNNEIGKLSTNLQKIDVRRLRGEECLSYMPYDIREELKPFVRTLERLIVCATRVDGRPGICGGDSGSPLVQGNTLIGITSFKGALPCDEARLGFYMNVANFVPWIKSVTGL